MVCSLRILVSSDNMGGELMSLLKFVSYTAVLTFCHVGTCCDEKQNLGHAQSCSLVNKVN